VFFALGELSVRVSISSRLWEFEVMWYECACMVYITENVFCRGSSRLGLFDVVAVVACGVTSCLLLAFCDAHFCHLFRSMTRWFARPTLFRPVSHMIRLYSHTARSDEEDCA